MSFYDLTINAIDGKVMNMADYKGKYVLCVNVASKCGYTPQYEDLEKLYEQYQGKLVIVGFPCNQFLGQEPGTSEEIVSFCQKNYGVTFPLMEKSIVIKKNHQNEVHKWLSDMTLNGWCNQEPAWNFCKYLINENGVLVNYFPMTIDPLDPLVIAAIEKK